ncbi:uncharacterized protein [Rutidosis leptorrhynchoides]|uniref:uncharacterized protein n=1 Tax=Rutidosis leptorrhynchoides TaxID=125765 RepID=UPI003A98D624
MEKKTALYMRRWEATTSFNAGLTPAGSRRSTWKEIIKTGSDIEDLGLSFKNSFVKKIGDGAATSFWNDLWIGDTVLKNKFKRLARLEENLQVTVKDRVKQNGSKCIGNWSWTRQPTGRANGELTELARLVESASIQPHKDDGWIWSLSSNGYFTTGCLSDLINLKILHAGQNNRETLRNNLVPKKIEVFSWRARKKRIPVLVELDKRGIDLNSVRCPLCDDDIESVNHSLILCKQVSGIWRKVFEWWGLNGLPSVQIEELLSNTNPGSSDIGKSIWQAVTWSCCYLIWKNRNQKVFSNKCWNIPVALNEIQVKSFEWIAKRCKKKSIDWHTWLHNPHTFLS